uniref:Zgc:195075 n=1 Tax=Sinocyclocheilus anshuiensis TaxID=1608454 RepID=A0A671MHE0_9TELE
MGCTCNVSLPERKIILLGKTGDGKSSTGNTILGENVFTTKASASNIIVEYQKRERKVHGRKITVIDTPGAFDTDRNDEETKSELLKALIDCAPEVDAFIVVLKVGRYTEHENEVVQKILNTFKDEHVLKHTVILFTFGEQLEGKTTEEFMKDCSQLQELVDKCGGRCHVIDNKYWNKRKRGNKSNKVQVKNLLKTIDKMVEENGCYSNGLLQMLEKEIQEEMKKNKNVPPEEQRERAKEIVHEIFLKQLVGASTGALIGALLGAGVALASVVAVLQAIHPLKEQLRAKAAVAVLGAGAAAGGAATAAEAAVAGGAAEAGAVAGGAGAAAGTGVSAGTTSAGVLGVAAVVGAVEGGITGWKAAEEADSVCDAMIKAATANYENATAAVEKIQEFVTLALNKKT